MRELLQSNAGDAGLSTGAAIGIALGVLGGVLVITAVLVYFYKRYGLPCFKELQGIVSLNACAACALAGMTPCPTPARSQSDGASIHTHTWVDRHDVMACPVSQSVRRKPAAHSFSSPAAARTQAAGVHGPGPHPGQQRRRSRQGPARHRRHRRRRQTGQRGPGRRGGRRGCRGGGGVGGARRERRRGHGRGGVQRPREPLRRWRQRETVQCRRQQAGLSGEWRCVLLRGCGAQQRP